MSADDDRTPVDRGTGRASGGDRTDARLDALSAKIEAEKRRDAERRGRPTDGPVSGMAQALKLGSEFVAGVIVGAVIGYTLDRFVGTAPWGMIVFLLLGFAAGTLNVLRATGRVAEKFPPPNRPRGGDES